MRHSKDRKIPFGRLNGTRYSAPTSSVIDPGDGAGEVLREERPEGLAFLDRIPAGRPVIEQADTKHGSLPRRL